MELIMDYSDSQIQDMLDDLYNVGKLKMLGYLPLRTLTDICKKNVDELKQELNEKGLFVQIFRPDECNVFSGAMYVADLNQLQNFLSAHDQKKILDSENWPHDAILFINQVATVNAEHETDLDLLIAMTFNNPLLTKEQVLHAYPVEKEAILPILENIISPKINHSQIKKNKV